MECIFCAVAAGEASSWVVYEDAHCVGFLDVGAATRGHTLVVPRAHVVDVFEMSEATAASLGVATHRVANLLMRRLSPAGLNVVQSNGQAAWQEVWHAHVHLVPRYEGDGLVPPWKSSHPTQEHLRDTHDLLTNAR
jgi:histidine triad (HIT) family protein